MKIIDSTPMKLYIVQIHKKLGKFSEGIKGIFMCMGTYVYIGILYICTYNKQKITASN